MLVLALWACDGPLPDLHDAPRPGDAEDGPKPQIRDGISLLAERGDVFGVVVDHCSLSWAVDELGDSGFRGVYDVTWSNNLFAEGLWDSLHAESPHAKGLLIGNHSRRIAGIGNVFAHNDDRNPVVAKDASALVANNFVYDPGTFAMVSPPHTGALWRASTKARTRSTAGSRAKGHPSTT